VVRPKIRWDGALWVVSVDHMFWTERSYHETWRAALEHALWVGLVSGVWRLW
jgi:hypothetical protein